jgi:hypothetical protein
MSKATIISLAAVTVGSVCAIALVWRHTHTAGNDQVSFSTADAAARTLLDAAENDDPAAMLLLFGASGKDLVQSGDAVRDRSRRNAFVEQAKRSMRVQPDPSDRKRAFILIGAEQFPFPVPVVKTRHGWSFDVDAGRDELLARRIGSNELDAINLCRRFVDAQYQFSSEDRDGSGVRQYAQRFISSPGKRDGLYWPAADGGPESPIADLVAEATEEGYDVSGALAVPYHGYNLKLLTGQGAGAKGGAKDYVVHDLMIGGFGLVAWPVEYGLSGIKTFIVNDAGVVLEKDFGRGADPKIREMKTFDPDSTWKVVE